jgi:hypothetical protein
VPRLHLADLTIVFTLYISTRSKGLITQVVNGKAAVGSKGCLLGQAMDAQAGTFASYVAAKRQQQVSDTSEWEEVCSQSRPCLFEH